jgi:hypothetical protein
MPNLAPCTPHQPNLLANTSFIMRMCFWLVFVSDFPVGSHQRSQPILFSIFIPLKLQRDNTPPHTFRLSCISSLKPLPPSMLTLNGLLYAPVKQRSPNIDSTSLSLFFHCSICPPKTIGEHSPHTFRPGLASSPMRSLRRHQLLVD